MRIAEGSRRTRDKGVRRKHAAGTVGVAGSEEQNLVEVAAQEDHRHLAELLLLMSLGHFDQAWEEGRGRRRERLEMRLSTLHKRTSRPSEAGDVSWQISGAGRCCSALFPRDAPPRAADSGRA